MKKLLIGLLVLVLCGAWRYRDLPMVSCAWCGTGGRVGNSLNRHHVIQQAARPDLAHDPGNLIVLCRRCHFVLGHRGNWRRYNPDVATICAVYTNAIALP